jgi:hypothetical protein
MSYVRGPFKKGQLLHIVSRAVESRKIFEVDNDCYRFIFQLYVANLGKRGYNLRTQDIVKAAKALLRGEEIPEKFIIKEHLPLVHFLDFSLVFNHYHFYLLSNIENGVPVLMQKLNGSFAKYFNIKYGREGALFGSRYKGIEVETDFQSAAVSRYVGVINPLDIYQPGWREKGLRNLEEAFRFLENYQFSSFPDKIGNRSSKILAPKEILEKYLIETNTEEYQKYIKDFLKQKSSPLQSFFLE